MSLGIDRLTRCVATSGKPSSLKTTQVQPLCEDTMRLLPLMLLVVCCTVKAEWVFVGGSDNSVHYVDSETIRGRGRIRQAWNLANLVSRDPEDGVFSQRHFYEHDCEERKSRTLQISTHSEKWAGGKVLSTGPGNGHWKPIAPQTVGEAMHNFVCSK